MKGINRSFTLGISRLRIEIPLPQQENREIIILWAVGGASSASRSDPWQVQFETRPHPFKPIHPPNAPVSQPGLLFGSHHDFHNLC